MSGQSLPLKLPIANISPSVSTESLVNSGTSINIAKPDKADFRDSLHKVERQQQIHDKPERNIPDKPPAEPRARDSRDNRSDQSPSKEQRVANENKPVKRDQSTEADNTSPTHSRAPNNDEARSSQQPDKTKSDGEQAQALAAGDNSSATSVATEATTTEGMSILGDNDNLLLPDTETVMPVIENASANVPVVELDNRSISMTIETDTETQLEGNILPQDIVLDTVIDEMAAITTELSAEASEDTESHVETAIDTKGVSADVSLLAAGVENPSAIPVETIVNPQLAAYKGQLPSKVQSIASDIARDKTLNSTVSVSTITDTAAADEITLSKIDSTTIKFDALVDKTTASSSPTASQLSQPQVGLSNNSGAELLSASESVVNAKVFADKIVQFGPNQYQAGSSFLANNALLSVDSLVNSPFAGASTPLSSAATGLPQINPGMPFQQAQWGQQVADKVLWMSAQGLKEAEIQMDPPELGPLTVKVSVTQDQAHVSFAVQHASVREALDQGALRLREMFAEEGLDLVDVDVSGQPQSEQQDTDEGSDQQGGSNTASDDSDNAITETALHIQSDSSSLINTYI